jgi:hypothetical protein
MSDLDFRKYWEDAFRWDDYLDREIHQHQEMWRSVLAKCGVPEWAVEEGARIGGEWRLLVISEDWCGDAVNTVPVMARMAEALPNVQLRIAKRDGNPGLMDAFLTSGSRSIPLAIVLRPDFSVAGRWGPRPPELQEFVLSEKKKGERPSSEIYRDVRRWYARDRGETTLRGLLEVMAAG